MARRILIVLLGLGAIAGFAGGFMQLHHMRHHGYGYGPGWEGGPGWGRHSEFEDHVADVCARAAERVIRDRPDHRDSPRPEPPPPPPGP
jgi:hypothetical protein